MVHNVNYEYLYWLPLTKSNKRYLNLKIFKRLFWTLVIIIGVSWGYNSRATLAPQLTNLIATSQLKLSAALSGRLGSAMMDNSAQADTKSAQPMSASSTSSQQTKSTVEKTAQSTATTTTANATPIESIVQNTKLSNTYYYHFSSNLSKAGRQVFLNAVATYNATGLVHLVAGKAPKNGNSITFSAYHKRMPAGDTTIELGHGGPEITKEVTWQKTRYWNNATASLNADYSAAFSDAVAVHELGHALGLDHSQSTMSVMYPVSQGRSALSTGDIQGLKSIY